MNYVIQLIGFTPFGSQETTRKEVQSGILKTTHTNEKNKFKQNNWLKTKLNWPDNRVLEFLLLWFLGNQTGFYYAVFMRDLMQRMAYLQAVTVIDSSFFGFCVPTSK